MPTSADIQAEDEHQEDTAVLYSDGRVHPIDPGHRLDDIIKITQVIINSFFYHLDTTIRHINIPICIKVLYRDVTLQLPKITIFRPGAIAKDESRQKIRISPLTYR